VVGSLVRSLAAKGFADMGQFVELKALGKAFWGVNGDSVTARREPAERGQWMSYSTG
jgi:hypothetical protein